MVLYVSSKGKRPGDENEKRETSGIELGEKEVRGMISL